MSARRNEWRRLDALLSGLEDDVLRLDDLTILSEDEGSAADVEHVRALIQFQTGAYAGTDHLQPAMNLGRVSSGEGTERPETTSIAMPEEEGELRRLLETLVANQPNLPKQVRIAFSAGGRPTGSEVNAIVAQLVRLGILKPSGKDD